MSDIYSTLNPQQQEAVYHTEGPLLILAGAGSGKTRVLTHRIAYLIDKKGINPWNILAITFTNKAASEMRERVDKIVGFGSESVWVSTFHSTCVRILRRYIDRLGYDTRFAIYDTEDQKTLMKEVCRKLNIDTKKTKERSLLAQISHAKDELITPDEMELNAGGDFVKKKVAEVYREYQAALRRNNALDFDDLIVKTVELFQNCGDVLENYQERFRYIMVDEYQDTNTAQFKFISLLASKYENLCVVGDDDQSIYGFRGAKPGIMLSFPKRFPDTKQIVLGVNYRCSDEIMKAAERLIGKNNERYEKHIVANKGKEQPVHMKKCENLPDEAEKIVAQIQMYQKEGIAYQEMAVLFRTNMQMRLLAGKLMEHGVPFTMRENLPNLFDTWMAKDIMCYLQLALGNRSREKFLKIANRPVRYLSRTAFTESEVSFDKLRAYYAVKNQEWMEERIWNFEYDLKNLASLSPYAAIHFIRKGIGYDEFLKTYADERNVNADDWFDVLDEMQEMARDKKSIPEFLSFVENYGDTLEEIRQEQKKQQVKEEPGVSLMTMHASKGLEFPVVFVPTLNEDIVPYRKAVQEGNLEEERRMLYVAMTRAKTYLHLSFVKERFHKEAEPSPFLYEISPALKNKINKKRGR